MVMFSCKELQFDYDKKQISQNLKKFKKILNSVKIYCAPHQHKNIWGVHYWLCGHESRRESILL